MNKKILIVLLLLITLPAFAQDVRTDLQKHFKDFNLVKLDKTEIVQKSKTSELVRVADFEFSISPRDLFVGLDEVKTFRGKLKDNPDSEIRLSVDDNLVKGYIFDGESRFYIESAAKFSNKASIKDHIIYKSEDRKDEQSPIRCLADDALQTGLSTTSPKVADTITSGLKTVRVIEIATDADYEWVTQAGGATKAKEEILSILNMAEGVYERQLGIIFSVTSQHAWEIPDQYSTVKMSELLFDFQKHWNANFSNVDRDVAFLFSGKFFAKGIASQGEICRSPRLAYGVTGREGDFSRTWKLFAHELGHSLGADHVQNSGDCALTIMNSSVYPLMEERFCQTSIDQITSFVNKYGSCLQQNTTNKTKFDFDGDSKSDISVFRRSDAHWYIMKSSGGYSFIKWGLGSDVLIPGDYDGDGKTDIAVFRGATLVGYGSGFLPNYWYILRSSDNTVLIKEWGTHAGSLYGRPVPADYDGDGRTDLAVYHSSDSIPHPGYFVILQSSTDSIFIKQWGTNTDSLVPTDYDGDGKADIAVYRDDALAGGESEIGNWYIWQSSTDMMKVEYFGLGEDKPVPADYDGDGKADIAVWRPSNGFWYRLNSSDRSFVAIPFGLSEDKPTPADYDGDGKTDIAVFRPSTGVWYLLRSRDGFTALLFGLENDIPIPNAYIR